MLELSDRATARAAAAAATAMVVAARARAAAATATAAAAAATATVEAATAMAAKVALVAEAEADALERAIADDGEGGNSGVAGPPEASEASEVPDDYVRPIANEIMTDPSSTAGGSTYERTAVSGARGLLGFLSDTDAGDACPAPRALTANPVDSNLSPHAVAFRPSPPSQHTDAITQARLMWHEAAAALGEDADAAASLLVVL